MYPQRRILLFGQSALMRQLGAILRVSPLLQVAERNAIDEMGKFHPDVIVVDSEEVTPEQFRQLLALDSTLLGIHPASYQLTVLSDLGHAHHLADTALVIEKLSLILRSSA